MKVQITGASGFVGSNLTNYLVNRGVEVSSISLRDNNWKYQMNTYSNAIVHLAGKAHDTSNTSSADEYFKVNRDLTIDLFQEFIESNIRDFFYFSSVKAVADTVSEILYEDVEGKPLTPYGKSKLEAEQYLLSQELPNNKRLFVIRPCMIHGPGNKGNLNLLYNVVKKGFPWPLAAFNNQRSFLSIDNLSYLLYEMLKNEGVTSGVYNFADDKALSTNELVVLISNTLNKKENLWHIPSSLINSAVKLGDLLRLPLNSERLKKLTESYVVSNNKIKTSLGIVNLPLSATEGLEITIKSFNERIN